MKKKIKNLLLASLLITSLVSCNTDNDVKSIALFAYTDTDPFIDSLISEIKNNFGDEYKVDIYYGTNNQTSQNKQIERVLSEKKHSALIVNLVDRMAAASIVKKSESSKLPLIFFNREPLLKDIENSPLTYYVGSNGQSEGQAQGKLVKSLFNYSKNNILGSEYDLNNDGKLNAVLLRGETGHQDTEERSKAVVNELNNFNINYIGIEACDWDRNKGEEAVRKINDEKETIELVLSNNDDMALGAVDFYKKNKQYKLPIIVGVNGTSEAKESIDKGEMIGTVVNDNAYQANIISNIAKELIETGKTSHEKMTFSPTRVYVA